MTDSDLSSVWSNELDLAGLRDVLLVLTKTSRPSATFGEARFDLGELRLRLVRDRGQDWLEVACPGTDDFWTLSEIGMALGWRTVESTIGRTEPLSLGAQLKELVERREQIEVALNPSELARTRSLVVEAQKRRQRRFLELLQENARLYRSRSGTT